MKYLSTRGGVRGATFEETLFSGYAPDGGLYLPEEIPKLSKETLKKWSTLSYPDLVKQILPLFISEEEVPSKELEGIIDRAFSRFDTPAVLEKAQLSEGLNILELWHGPTLSFKDLSLSCVGQLIEYFLNKRQQHCTILVATSGDTGSAAIESVRGFKWADIVVLTPRDRCTRIQELQMTTVIEDNVHVFRVDSPCDDLDVPIKALFMDEEFAKQNNLFSINSFNWARIVVQMAHYFYAYLQMDPEEGEEVEVVVPTGGCGNLTAGTIAREMGLPVNLVTTVNENDIVARTVSQGDFSLAASVKVTLASAMDIGVPYNMERLFYIFYEGDTQQVASIMTKMEAEGRAAIPTDLLEKMKACYGSCKVDDEGIKQAMVHCWNKNQYLLCPHTAVAAKYHYDNSTSKKRICISTASPAKFEEAVTSAGLTPQPTESVKALSTMPTRCRDMEKDDDWEGILRHFLRDMAKKRTTEGLCQ